MQTTLSDFAIKTDQFEGPLELLLDLIEKRKLLINDISLASVTDEYMAYVKEMQEHPVRETAQFVLVASTLLLIKSKSLLPVLDLTDEEEESIEDLEHRLRLYQIFREAGKELGTVFGKTLLFEKRYIRNDEPLFLTDKYTNNDALLEAIRDVLKNLPRKVVKKAVSVRQVISLEEMIDRLHKRVTNQLRLTFKEFSGDEKEKGNVIVGFLAVLELVKQGSVLVEQEKHYADITILRESRGVPEYG